MTTASVTRRELLAAATGAVVVAGYDTLARRWVDVAEAASCRPFEGAPQLDGKLLLDAASRTRDRTDRGNMVFHTPAAVLQPGSVRDIQAMVRFCRRCGIKVAARGEHHTTHGQGLTDGLVIEMRALSTIHSIGPDGADVDAGVLWRDLIKAAFAKGLRRPGLTGYTGLSVGGVLSVGGCPGSNNEGAIVDSVRELTVVTGKGDLVRCSATHSRDLFEAALGGLGQCSIIVRARLDLVPAKPMARQFLLHYVDPKAFWKDFRTLARRGECNDVYNVCMPPGSSVFVYQINATVFFDPADPPDNAHLMRGLTLPAIAAVPLDLPYVTYTQFVDTQVAALQLTQWDQLVKPWFDVWLPEPAAEAYVTDVLAHLKPEDIAPTGFILLFAQRRSKLTRPFLRMPAPELGEWVYLFDILNASPLPGPNPTFARKMLDRNRRWFDRARELGATRYPIGSLDFDREDWKRHYGDQWPRLKKIKRRYDPDTILTPGPGIF